MIVTSRLSAWPGDHSGQEVLAVSREQATRFLLDRTANRRHATAEDEARAGDLADRLGGLPLALEQAAAAIAYRRLSLANYLRAWDEEKQSVLGWYDPKVLGDYREPLAVTWQRSVEDLGPAAQYLLRLAAHLAPDPIPAELFDAIVPIGEGGEMAARQTIPEGIPELAAYSMIRFDGKRITVHPMVQEVTRLPIPSEGRRAWLEVAVQLLVLLAPDRARDVRKLAAMGSASASCPGHPIADGERRTGASGGIIPRGGRKGRGERPSRRRETR